MNTKILEELGFNDKEIKVYLALLRCGSISASKVSKETNIDRATCYRYIDSLIHKGFVSCVIENNMKYFNAAHPEKILSDLKQKEKDYKEILPELLSLEKIPKEETITEMYRGKEGLKTVLKNILRTKEDHCVLGDEGHFQDLLPVYFGQFINSCLKNKIKEKILCSEKVKNKIQKYDYKHSETRALPHNVVVPTTTLIYSDKIVLFDWELPFSAVVIKNKNMALSYKSYFELLWKTAKK
ncbi:MAG: helix-turn-helix domain-containing protein [archaeon]